LSSKVKASIASVWTDRDGWLMAGWLVACESRLTSLTPDSHRQIARALKITRALPRPRARKEMRVEQRKP